MKYRWCYGLFAALLSCCAGWSHTLPTPESIASLRILADPQINADGTSIAYTVATPQRLGKPPVQRIWRVASNGAGAAEALPVPEHPEPPQNAKASKDIHDTHPR